MDRLTAARRHFFEKPKNRRAWLFIGVLLPIFILLLVTSAPKHSLSFRRLTQAAKATPLNNRQCPYGTVYIYDIPPEFNRKILEHCEDIDPANSYCNPLSNSGLGPKSAALDGVVPPDLLPAWYDTNQYSAEVIFHNRMSNYKCRTSDAKSASAFYVPYYAGLANRRYFTGNHSAKERDEQLQPFLQWLTSQPTWQRSKGADHFMVLGRVSSDFRRQSDERWGNTFALMPPMRQTVRLSLERHPWDRYEVGLPYPTGFHPGSKSDLEKWLKFIRTRTRSTLYTFVGGKRPKRQEDFRALLSGQCESDPDSCKVVDCAAPGKPCSDGNPAVIGAFLDSTFCLQPRGDSFTRKSTFDCMLAGAIPVVFWKRSIYGQYDWFLRDDPERFAVFVDEKLVRNGTSVKRILEGYGVEEIQMMRERISNMISRFLYAGAGSGETVRDAFDIAVDGVLRRFKDLRGADQV